jgi:outer membrane lipoprotein carrier protein
LKKFLITSLLLASQVFASMDNITSFEADFQQDIKDEKNKVLSYKGHVYAHKPQFAKWEYKTPVDKTIYITPFDVTIVEPEIEQVIVRRIESSFNFFKLIKNAKKIEKDTYEAKYKNTIFTIKKENGLIKSISYMDEFENNVVISFDNQKQNHEIPLMIFQAKYPLEYDVIRD